MANGTGQEEGANLGGAALEAAQIGSQTCLQRGLVLLGDAALRRSHSKSTIDYTRNAQSLGKLHLAPTGGGPWDGSVRPAIDTVA
jgi:hypothetical protein